MTTHYNLSDSCQARHGASQPPRPRPRPPSEKPSPTGCLTLGLVGGYIAVAWKTVLISSFGFKNAEPNCFQYVANNSIHSRPRPPLQKLSPTIRGRLFGHLLGWWFYTGWLVGLLVLYLWDGYWLGGFILGGWRAELIFWFCTACVQNRLLSEVPRKLQLCTFNVGECISCAADTHLTTNLSAHTILS